MASERIRSPALDDRNYKQTLNLLPGENLIPVLERGVEIAVPPNGHFLLASVHEHQLEGRLGHSIFSLDIYPYCGAASIEVKDEPVGEISRLTIKRTVEAGFKVGESVDLAYLGTVHWKYAGLDLNNRRQLGWRDPASLCELAVNLRTAQARSAGDIALMGLAVIGNKTAEFEGAMRKIGLNLELGKPLRQQLIECTQDQVNVFWQRHRGALVGNID